MKKEVSIQDAAMAAAEPTERELRMGRQIDELTNSLTEALRENARLRAALDVGRKKGRKE